MLHICTYKKVNFIILMYKLVNYDNYGKKKGNQIKQINSLYIYIYSFIL